MDTGKTKNECAATTLNANSHNISCQSMKENVSKSRGSASSSYSFASNSAKQQASNFDCESTDKKQSSLMADVDSGYEAMDIEESETNDGRRKRVYSSTDVTDEYLMEVIRRIFRITFASDNDGVFLPEIARQLDQDGAFEGYEDLISQILMEVLFILKSSEENPFEFYTTQNPTAGSSRSNRLACEFYDCVIILLTVERSK